MENSPYILQQGLFSIFLELFNWSLTTMISKTLTFSLSSLKCLSLICCGLTIACLNSQSVQANDDLPKAETVLAKYVEVTGGKAAYDNIKNRVSKATLSFPGQNIEIAISVYTAKPNKAYMVIESDLTGKIEEGSNGKVTWSISQQTGPVVNEGKIHEYTRIKMAFDDLTYWKKYYTNPKCTGSEKVDGKDCFVVQLTPKVSDEKIKLKPETYYFDKKTSLLLKIKGTLITPMGDFEAEFSFSDFRKVDGIKMPYKAVMAVLGQKRVFTTKSVKHNVNMPKDRFDLPDEIKKLVEKDK